MSRLADVTAISSKASSTASADGMRNAALICESWAYPFTILTG